MKLSDVRLGGLYTLSGRHGDTVRITKTGVTLSTQNAPGVAWKFWPDETRSGKGAARDLRPYQGNGRTPEWACCDKAAVMPCVCVYSFTCPDHGERHVGSHD